VDLGVGFRKTDHGRREESLPCGRVLGIGVDYQCLHSTSGYGPGKLHGQGRLSLPAFLMTDSDNERSNQKPKIRITAGRIIIQNALP
jgi:hypothetical protein